MAFKVVTAAWNAQPWIQDCLISIANQQNVDVDCCVVVDYGADRTADIAQSLCKDLGFECIVRTEKANTLTNQVEAIRTLDGGDPNDVIVFVDGDDQLSGHRALESVQYAYADGATALTYGSYASVPFSPTCAPAQPYPPEVVANNSYREYARNGKGILWNHLRTFKYELFNQLGESDFTGPDGEYLECGPDATLMFPCLELANGNIKFLREVLLNYNSENPQSEWRKDPKQVNRDHDWVLTRSPKS